MADENKFAQVQQLTQQWTHQWEQLFEELGRYAKESYALAERTSGEWRRLAADAARRTADILVPKLP